MAVAQKPPPSLFLFLCMEEGNSIHSPLSCPLTITPCPGWLELFEGQKMLRLTYLQILHNTAFPAHRNTCSVLAYWFLISFLIFCKRQHLGCRQGKHFQYEYLMKMKSACSMLFILLSNKPMLSNRLITAAISSDNFLAASMPRRNSFQHYYSSGKLITWSLKNSRL